MTNYQWRYLLLCLSLFLALSAYRSQPDSIDGENLIAVAVNLVNHQTFSTAVVSAEQDLGYIGLDGRRYTAKGIGPSLVMLPLVGLAHITPHLGYRAAVLLLNPLVFIATLWLLARFAEQVGATTAQAVILALVVGMSTMLWVYVKGSYGEPLAGLCLLSAAYSAYCWRETHQTRWLWFAGLAIALAMSANLSYGVSAVLLSLWLFVPRLRTFNGSLVVDGLRYAMPIVLTVMLVGLYNFVRFGSPLQSGYTLPDRIEGFTHDFWTGVWGMTLGLERGALWFNPSLLLSLIGLPLLWRRDGWLTSLIVILALGQISTYASWWAWDGGVAWGPRFVLPVLPLLGLLWLPCLQPRRWLLLSGLIGASMVIQLLGLSADLTRALQNYPLSEHQFIAQWQHLIIGQRIDMAWGRFGVDVVQLALIAMPLVLALMVKRLNNAWPLLLLVGGLALFGLAVRQDVQSGLSRFHVMQQALSPRGAVLSATLAFGSDWLDFKDGGQVHVLRPQVTADTPHMRGLFEHAAAEQPYLWFVTWLPQDSPENWMEAELRMRFPVEHETFVSGHRALLFRTQP